MPKSIKVNQLKKEVIVSQMPYRTGVIQFITTGTNNKETKLDKIIKIKDK